jgi:hypothetical protein
VRVAAIFSFLRAGVRGVRTRDVDDGSEWRFPSFSLSLSLSLSFSLSGNLWLSRWRHDPRRSEVRLDYLDVSIADARPSRKNGRERTDLFPEECKKKYYTRQHCDPRRPRNCDGEDRSLPCCVSLVPRERGGVSGAMA